MIRTRGTHRLGGLLGMLLCAGAFASEPSFEFWSDKEGDAVVRRTDSGADGGISAVSTLPDFVEFRLGGWNATSPTTDPYEGSWSSSSSPNLLRLDVTFAGVVNPPGTLGLGSQSFNPFAFGSSPVYGFIEFDIDRNRDTGGECSGATLRYLANVGRFGRVPTGSLAARMAITGEDCDWSFATSPQIERSGADFSLVMCGCFDVTVIDTFGDSDGVFNAGDTWIVRGRFFQRAGGLAEASGVWGGSAPHAYDPWVKVRFRHDLTTDQTTISLVYSMTMQGASLLTGQPQQSMDLNVNNHTSVREAMEDIVAGAIDAMSPCGQELAKGWEDPDWDDVMDPTRWRVRALVGTTYVNQEDALYVWTDVGCAEHFGDFSNDGTSNAADVSAFDAYLAANDAGALDGDGTVNGSISLIDVGPNFALYDLSGDGVINAADRTLLTPPPAGDVNGDCFVNGADLSVILSNFGASVPVNTDGDLNGDGLVNGADLSVLLANFGAAC